MNLDHGMIACSPDTDMTAASNILVLATGGTIAQSSDSTRMLSIEDILKSVPGIDSQSRVVSEQLFEVVSPDINPGHWMILGERVNKALNSDGYDSVVVTHGTDTLEETAFYLNLVVDSTKPVIVVGSMRKSDSLNADGPINLYNALAVAASPQSVGLGVLVTTNGQIESARDVAKHHTTAIEAFRSPLFGSLGCVHDGHVSFYRSPMRRHTTRSDFSASAISELPRTDIFIGYAGVGREGLDALRLAGAKGVVIAGTGDGSIPSALMPAVRDLLDAGIVVVRSSRTGSGIVTRNGESDDDAEGLVVADSLNPQKARVLLMLALTRTTDVTAIQECFSCY
ncbi:asparaginase [Pseudomonas syringae]|uniref:Glutaminase-asparaginase n=1 Tax=Pseudomonas syringae pv. actinidiae TaxID=103796 RepID=A0A2V0Q803_PSESF|nr:asparaginase [Pseudomonas syringae]BBI43220.1 putative L-asparaginase [Pseudomonas syringae pv. actinidiae]GBH08804.1 L-asparaginase/archaeal Glu-tRNAGln amidotransferase subunit D [Pseudomonas syringae pv. actinidiae]